MQFVPLPLPTPAFLSSNWDIKYTKNCHVHFLSTIYFSPQPSISTSHTSYCAFTSLYTTHPPTSSLPNPFPACLHYWGRYERDTRRCKNISYPLFSHSLFPLTIQRRNAYRLNLLFLGTNQADAPCPFFFFFAQREPSLVYAPFLIPWHRR